MLLTRMAVGRCDPDQVWYCALKHFFVAIVIIGFTEELGKASSVFFLRFTEDTIPSRFPTWWRIIRSPTAVVACAAAGGMGFSVLENIKYVLVPIDLGDDEDNVSAMATAIMRILITSPMHVCWTALVGVSLARWVFFTSEGKARGVIEVIQNNFQFRAVESNHNNHEEVLHNMLTSPLSPLRSPLHLKQQARQTGVQSPIIIVGGENISALEYASNNQVHINHASNSHNHDNPANRTSMNNNAAEHINDAPPSLFSISEASLYDTSHLAFHNHSDNNQAAEHSTANPLPANLNQRTTAILDPSWTAPLAPMPSNERDGAFDSSKSPGYLVPITKDRLSVGIFRGIMPAAILHGLFDFFLMMSTAVATLAKKKATLQNKKSSWILGVVSDTTFNPYATLLHSDENKSSMSFVDVAKKNVMKVMVNLIEMSITSISEQHDDRIPNQSPISEQQFLEEIELLRRNASNPSPLMLNDSQSLTEEQKYEIICSLLILFALLIWIISLILVYWAWNRVVKHETFALQDLWLHQRLSLHNNNSNNHSNHQNNSNINEVYYDLDIDGQVGGGGSGTDRNGYFRRQDLNSHQFEEGNNASLMPNHNEEFYNNFSSQFRRDTRRGGNSVAPL